MSLNQPSKVLCCLLLLHAQVKGYRNILKLTCILFVFTLYKAFLKNKRGLGIISLPNFLHGNLFPSRYILSGITHISNLPTVCVKMTLNSRPTHPVPFTSKCQICRKSMFITSDIKLV